MGGILPAYRGDSSWRASYSTQPFRSSPEFSQHEDSRNGADDAWVRAHAGQVIGVLGPQDRVTAARLTHRTTLRPPARSPRPMPPKPGTDPVVAKRRVWISVCGSPSLFASRSPAWHVSAASMGARAAPWRKAKVPCRFRVPFLLLGRRTRRSTAVRHRGLPLPLTPFVRRRNRLFRATALLVIRARRSQSIGMTSVTWLWWIAMARRKDSEEQIANLAGKASGMADFSPEE